MRLRLVGSGPAPEVRALAATAGVELLADVADVAPSYAWADLAVVPLRAGGGTRIKVLEAFAHGVPVVSTAVGAEGLDVVDGVHLRIADGAEAFAAACRQLATEPALARRLVENAAAVAERHARPRVVTALRERLRDPLQAR